MLGLCRGWLLGSKLSVNWGSLTDVTFLDELKQRNWDILLFLSYFVLCTLSLGYRLNAVGIHVVLGFVTFLVQSLVLSRWGLCEYRMQQ